MAKYLPSYIAPALVGLIAIPILTRLFAPEEYGLYVLVMATVSVLTSVAIGWLSESVVRFFPAYEARLGEFYNTVLIFILISIVAMSLLFLGVLSLIEDNISINLASLMRLGVLVFVANCLMIPQSFLRAKRQVGWLTSFKVWHSVAGLGIGIALVLLLHRGVENLLWGQFLSIAVIFPLLYVLTIGKGISIRKGISLSMASEMSKYGFPMAVSFLTFWLLSLSDRYILELFRGSQEVGIYSASYAISEGSITLLMGVFVVAAGPIAIQIWEKQGVEASQEFLTKLTRYILLICLPAAVGLSMLAKPIIHVLVAPEYHEGYRIIPLVASALFFSGVTYSFGLIFSYIKKTYLGMTLAVVAALLNVGLNFLLVPRYGYMAAALTTLIAYSVYLFLMVIVSRRFLTWEFPLKFLGKAVGASAVMGVVVYLLSSHPPASPWVNLLVTISFGVIIYFVVLFLLRGLQSDEIETVLAWVRRTFRR